MTDTPGEATPGATGKGRPTPKRPTSKGPVAPPPMTRREAAKRVRSQGATRRQQLRAGRVTGDDEYLLARDQGPVRRLVRDLVDSRRTTATLLLPAAVLPLAGSLTGIDQVIALTQILWIFAITLALADFVGGGLRIRRAIAERFPDEQRTRGHIFYGIVRMLQFRRLRVPKPRVAVGDVV